MIKRPELAHGGKGLKLRGVPQIIAYEAAERFAFYGMLAMGAMLMTTSMVPAATEAEARRYVTWLGGAVFCLVFAGAIAAEAFLGKFRTVIAGSMIACAGYGTLALVPTQWATAVGQWPVLAIGLGLVALGTGAVKPCIAAHLGDQFHEANKHLLSKTFAWFYFVIHAAPLIAGALSHYLVADSRFGLRWALLLPVIALVMGTLLLWHGRTRFVQVPAFGRSFADELFSRETGAALVRLLGLYVLVAIFWIAWQQGAAEGWTRQASGMDLRLFNLELLPEQIATANVIFILLFVPLLTHVVYPIAIGFGEVTPFRKIGAGLFLTSVSFGVAAAIQKAIDSGGEPAVAWQLVAWAFLTLGEVMVIVTALELSYTWAPRKIKSVVMAVWLLTFAVRDLPVREIAGPRMNDFNYYMFFAGFMALATLIFAFVAKFYRHKTYLHSQDQPLDEVEAVAPTLGGGAPT